MERIHGKGREEGEGGYCEREVESGVLEMSTMRIPFHCDRFTSM